MLLDANHNNIISKNIYIDNIKVDESQFEVKDYSIKLQFAKIFNKKKRKIKIIQIIKQHFENYCSQELILDEKGISVRFLIYLENDLNLDDISNKNYIVNKELNLAYFEGITTTETENHHGYIYYSKQIDFLIYKYIPELTENILQNIIINKEKDNQPNLNYIEIYRKIVITEKGQNIEEINLMKVSNYN